MANKSVLLLDVRPSENLLLVKNHDDDDNEEGKENISNERVEDVTLENKNDFKVSSR